MHQIFKQEREVAQKSNFVSKGCSRNYPQGGTFFSDPFIPRTHMESEPPDPQDSSVNQTPHSPGHVL